MRFGELQWQTALVAVSSALFVVIVLFTLTATWAQTQSERQQELSWWVKADVGTTLIVVRVLQGLLTAVSSAAMTDSFTRLHWNRINNEKGLPLPDLLALSPTTSFMGTIRLVFGANAKMGTRVSAFTRALLTMLPPLAGILLFGTLLHLTRHPSETDQA